MLPSQHVPHPALGDQGVRPAPRRVGELADPPPQDVDECRLAGIGGGTLQVGKGSTAIKTGRADTCALATGRAALCWAQDVPNRSSALNILS